MKLDQLEASPPEPQSRRSSFRDNLYSVLLEHQRGGSGSLGLSGLWPAVLGPGTIPLSGCLCLCATLKPWVYHEWLTGVLFYPLYRTLGAPGLQVLKYALGLATVGAIYLTARRRGADLLPTVLILCFSILRPCPWVTARSGPRFSPISSLPSSSTCWRPPDCRARERRYGFWCRSRCVWCNLHGGFLAGLGLILLYAVGEALSRRPFRALSRVVPAGRAGHADQPLWLEILELPGPGGDDAASGNHRMGLAT